MKKNFAILIFCLIFASCSENQIAKQYGGNMRIELPPGQKLITVTWKDESDIWYLTRPMNSDEFPETYTFYQEKGAIFSLTGNGTVTILERN